MTLLRYDLRRSNKIMDRIYSGCWCLYSCIIIQLPFSCRYEKLQLHSTLEVVANTDPPDFMNSVGIRSGALVGFELPYSYG